jgi:hypothetical protein
MALPTLADRFGPWCGWCLDYVDVKDRTGEPGAWERQHVEQQWLRRGGPASPLKDLGPLSYIWDDWTIPVHRKCHPVLDHYSHQAGWPLDRLVNKLPQRVLEAERLAHGWFERGLYAFCVRVRQALRRYYEHESPSPDLQRLNFKFECIAAAGLWLVRRSSVVSLLDTLALEFPTLAIEPSVNPDYVAYIVNLFATSGRRVQVLELATAISNILSSRPRAMALVGKNQRALAYGLFDEAATRRAIEFSRDQAPIAQLMTAQLAAVGTALSLGRRQDDHRSYDLAQQLRAFGSVDCFWHQMQTDFLTACAEYVTAPDRLQSVLGRLLSAQYLTVCLGLRGWALPDIRQSRRQQNEFLSPIELLSWLVEKHRVSRTILRDLRDVWIGYSLRDQVWRTLAETGGDVA